MYKFKLQVTAMFIAMCVFIVIVKFCDIQDIQITNPVVELWRDLEYNLFERW
jgi:hypothetical protein